MNLGKVTTGRQDHRYIVRNCPCCDLAIITANLPDTLKDVPDGMIVILESTGNLRVEDPADYEDPGDVSGGGP